MVITQISSLYGIIPIVASTTEPYIFTIVEFLIDSSPTLRWLALFGLGQLTGILNAVFRAFAFVWRSVFLDHRILLVLSACSLISLRTASSASSLDGGPFSRALGCHCRPTRSLVVRGVSSLVSVVLKLSPWCHDPAVFAASASRALIWKLPPVVFLVFRQSLIIGIALLFTVIRRMFSSKWDEHVVGAKLQKRTKALKG
ncbi:hypothetical protein K438DRAFT_2030514 [Mycena galopus ATCC 62051]|nr:hypothetical protein K438DRAFT_2030514 [Mycena galopus ATCC 62051]